LISYSDRHYLPLVLKFRFSVVWVLVTFKFRDWLEDPLGAATYNGISPLGVPETPKVLKFILLYTSAEGAPDNIKFIVPLISIGFPVVIRFNEPFADSPPVWFPTTDSTNGLWAINPFTAGSKPDASIYRSP